MLLVLTLFRLCLNVASTRLILSEARAGNVINAFGTFVVAGSYVVGFVIFAILVVIQFVVITKGAGRISEVAARFTLDAMPGKQMSIDADLNAGLIDEVEARRRREEIVQEMSGAVTQAVQLDATDEKALKAVGIENIDVAIVAIGENLQASILISILLEDMGVKEVIAKARTPLHGRILEKIGADRVIFPEKEMGECISKEM